MSTLKPSGQKTEASTPYQGYRRSFGLYNCTGCNRHWYSSSSWANFGQQCRECLMNVFPHRQWPLKKRKTTSRPTHNIQVHMQDLCGKCKAVGGNCRLFKGKSNKID